jgi:hypothetical protein
MPAGLALPHKVIRGALQLSDDVEQTGKVIMIACGPRNNENPWNGAGIEVEPFDIDGKATRARIEHGVRGHFIRLKLLRRAELRSIEFKPQDDDLEVRITYFDIVRSRRAVATYLVGQLLSFSNGG